MRGTLRKRRLRTEALTLGVASHCCCRQHPSPHAQRGTSQYPCRSSASYTLLCFVLCSVVISLLSTNPEAAKAVVLAEKPVIADDTSALDPALLTQLIDNIASLSSIYHKVTSRISSASACNAHCVLFR